MDFVGQALLDGLQPLEHAEPRLREVHVPVEVHPDERQSAARARAHLPDAGDAVHHGFDRYGDALFDLFGRQPAGLDLYDDARFADFGEDVYGESAPHAPSNGCGQTRGREHQLWVREQNVEQAFHGRTLSGSSLLIMFMN